VFARAQGSTLASASWLGIPGNTLLYAIYVIGLITALMTAIYMTRMMLYTFHGPNRTGAQEESHLQEAPWVMTAPLVVLALLTVVGGWLNLPEVITDTLDAQDAMKRHTTRATMAVLIATALHAIATGNMLPAYVTEPDGSMRELPTICVDSSEFVVSKLKDRGTHQAFGVVTNAQDFMHILRLYVERELSEREASKGATQTSKARA